MNTNSTITPKIGASKTAKPGKGKAANATGKAARFSFRITLETHAIGKFGLPRTKRTYQHGRSAGFYGLVATTLAAQRAEAKQALPNFAPSLGDGWDAKALVMHAVRISGWLKHMDPGSLNDADQIQIAGGNQLAREIAVQIGREDAENEGVLFLKIWLSLDWAEAADVPHSASITNYLEQMISRDCASLGLNETEFRQKALGIIASLRF